MSTRLRTRLRIVADRRLLRWGDENRHPGRRRIYRQDRGAGPLRAADRREVHDAFRRKGVAAVSGCGMMPGWTELLSAHFLAGGRTAAGERQEPAPRRYLFCSLDRFGGYAFFRRVARAPGREETAPSGSPPGGAFVLGEDFFGLPPGRPAGFFRRVGRTRGG